VHSVRYISTSKVQVLLENVTALEHISIQSITKKKPCRPNEFQVIRYHKARTCGLGYPIDYKESLPGYVLYTITRNIPDIYVGQNIEGIFTIEDIHSSENGSFSLEEYYETQYIYYRARLREESTRRIYGTPSLEGRIAQFVSSRFLSAVAELYGQEEYAKLNKKEKDTIAIASALLLGTRRYFSQELENMLRTGGLIHSVVLSGLHVSSLLLFVFPLMFLCIRFFPRILWYGSARIYTLGLLIICAFIYASITSFPLAYMRALCMLCVIYIFTASYQRYTLLDALLYTIVCVLCISPQTLLTLSFQLSAGAVFAIYLSLPCTRAYIERVSKSAFPSFIRSIAIICGSIIISSLFINIILAPLLLGTFGSVPHHIFLNILWLPILSSFVLPLLLLAFFFSLCGVNIVCIWYLGLFPIKVLVEVLHFLQSQAWFDIIVYMRPHAMTNIAFYLMIFIC
ncbi:MAG: ComEC/Rec2 family competence protein, partial [Desulfovibrionaceae bacterium]|nr:ComEC/Rec2 family competence protein [Desulfovibrionaceae bacterium]